jgi:dolichol kinase
LYLIVGRELTITFLTIALVVFFMVEPLRVSSNKAKKIIEKMSSYLTPEVYKFLNDRFDKLVKSLREIEREEERMCIGAHIYFSIASLIIIFLFPQMIVIGAITVAVLGDAVAAIIGKSFGRHRFKNGKSWEGTIAFFLTSFGILIGILPYGYSINFSIAGAFVGSIVGTFVELYNVPPNDNFSNQILMSLALYLLLFLF